MIWDRLRRLDPRLKDAALVAALLPIYLGWAARREPLALTVPLALAQTLPLLVRRRHAVSALAVVVAAALVANLGFGTLFPFAPALAIFTVAVHVERRVALRAGFVALLVLAVPVLRVPHFAAGQFVFRLIAFAAAWIVGDSLRTRRAYVQELESRAERLEREREESVRRAAAQEQARIARELHDVIAHNVSVMVVLASAANHVFDAQPERARDALRSIEQTGRSALLELRRLLGAVRTPVEDVFAPQPGLGRLDDLVEQVRAAGLPVVLRLEGDVGGLPAGLDLSAYRIVQEALTNALKHGHASIAEVTVRRTEGGLELEIADDGVGVAETGAELGHGLIGMRERASLLGGELEAGPAEGGGFRVRARLPLRQEQPA